MAFSHTYAAVRQALFQRTFGQFSLAWTEVQDCTDGPGSQQRVKDRLRQKMIEAWLHVGVLACRLLGGVTRLVVLVVVILAATAAGAIDMIFEDLLSQANLRKINK